MDQRERLKKTQLHEKSSHVCFCRYFLCDIFLWINFYANKAIKFSHFQVVQVISMVLELSRQQAFSSALAKSITFPED